MPEEYYEAYNFMNDILLLGMAADCWRTYTNKQLNDTWLEFQRRESILLEAHSVGTFGSYYYVAQELYYQIAKDFRNVMKVTGNL